MSCYSIVSWEIYRSCWKFNGCNVFCSFTLPSVKQNARGIPSPSINKPISTIGLGRCSLDTPYFLIPLSFSICLFAEYVIDISAVSWLFNSSIYALAHAIGSSWIFFKSSYLPSLSTHLLVDFPFSSRKDLYKYWN